MYYTCTMYNGILLLFFHFRPPPPPPPLWEREILATDNSSAVCSGTVLPHGLPLAIWCGHVLHCVLRVKSSKWRPSVGWPRPYATHMTSSRSCKWRLLSFGIWISSPSMSVRGRESPLSLALSTACKRQSGTNVILSISQKQSMFLRPPPPTHCGSPPFPIGLACWIAYRWPVFVCICTALWIDKFCIFIENNCWKRWDFVCIWSHFN